MFFSVVGYAPEKKIIEMRIKVIIDNEIIKSTKSTIYWNWMISWMKNLHVEHFFM